MYNKTIYRQFEHFSFNLNDWYCQVGLSYSIFSFSFDLRILIIPLVSLSSS